MRYKLSKSLKEEKNKFEIEIFKETLNNSNHQGEKKIALLNIWLLCEFQINAYFIDFYLHELSHLILDAAYKSPFNDKTVERKIRTKNNFAKNYFLSEMT